MSNLSVCHRSVAATVGIYSYILVGTVRQRCMRPTVLIVCRQLLVLILRVCVCRVQTECRAKRPNLREFKHQLRSSPLHVGSVVLLHGLGERPVGNLHRHRRPIFILRAAHIDHSGLLVHLDLRIVRHFKAVRALKDIV